MNERPGFMLYFELMDALNTLEDAEAGKLFKALMAYAQWGEVRELTGVADFAFRIARPRIDKDAERYAERCQKNAYSVYVREARRQQVEPLEYEEWRCRASDDIERYPTTTTTAAAAPPNTAPAAAATQKTNQNTNLFSKTKQGKAVSASPAQDADTTWVRTYLEQRDQELAKRKRTAKG